MALPLNPAETSHKHSDPIHEIEMYKNIPKPGPLRLVAVQEKIRSLLREFVACYELLIGYDVRANFRNATLTRLLVSIWSVQRNVIVHLYAAACLQHQRIWFLWNHALNVIEVYIAKEKWKMAGLEATTDRLVLLPWASKLKSCLPV
jgi:hypothetical protein